MDPLYRRLPAVHRLVASDQLAEFVERLGRPAVTEACRQAVEELREAAGQLEPAAFEAACAALPGRVKEQIEAGLRRSYAGVINATGVLLHTNLGRAPLSSPAPEQLAGYLALEYDLEAGRRGQRLAFLAGRLRESFGAEAAVMVNNNAAAVLLLLAAHTAGRRVIVSRGQLIEIGGSFRLPDVMAASGARLAEVGCTNRTHLDDYRRAIVEDTAAILVAHRSNFRLQGFTTEPTVRELADLAHRSNLPLFVDQGSGALHDLRRWGLSHEPTVRELLAAGADAICFSGDKLLGGPQAGIVVGRARWVEPLGRHPLFRALRPDKSALVWMERTLVAHHAGRLDQIPLYAMLGTPEDQLRRRARRLARRLRSRAVPATATATRATLGGGTTPGTEIPSHGLSLPGGDRLARALRNGTPPVVGTIRGADVILDLRTVLPSQDGELVEAVATAVARSSETL